MAEQRFWDTNKKFPIIFEDGEKVIFTNPTGEIFIHCLKNNVEVRIGNYPIGNGGIQFTTNALVEPTLFNPQTLGWKITPLNPPRESPHR